MREMHYLHSQRLRYVIVADDEQLRELGRTTEGVALLSGAVQQISRPEAMRVSEHLP